MMKFIAYQLIAVFIFATGAMAQNSDASFTLPSAKLANTSAGRVLKISSLFYETNDGRKTLSSFIPAGYAIKNKVEKLERMPDGRTITIGVTPVGDTFDISLTAKPSDGIKKWGLSIDSEADEYYTGLMERTVDRPQQASWAPGITDAMNLRGQKVDMIIKPTTSVYAPFYLSSRGYGVFVKGNWPGYFDFAASEPNKVKIEFEGPAFELKVYTADNPTAIVIAHSKDVGFPVLPPKWMFRPWRWRDEHTQRAEYYDGTKVTGPFNSEIMEDVLMMKAYGIPNGVYWIDRPWGPGRMGYDDFEIDEKRLPNFKRMVDWLGSEDQKMVLWIAPFFQGKMAEEATAKGYTPAAQTRPSNGNNFPMVDLSNPAAKLYWQKGIEKLLKLGVAGFKLDRGEENIPDDGKPNIFDGRTVRENRNAYTPMYIKAVYDIAKQHRGSDFFIMPRAAYTGTAQYAVNWGGDIGSSQEGLRASIIAQQRSAVMGYSNWGSDTCGYTQQQMDQEVCGRWLAFSAFSPIMEIGPTRNVAFWSAPREPKYDATLIALWRMYARLHERLLVYSYSRALEAHATGMPIVRPLFMADPKAKTAWDNWWTYMYGPDILISPIWEKGKTEQQVYLPAGMKWKNAWDGKISNGGQTVTVKAELHQIPIFIRVGSKVNFGDLNKEWKQSQAIAQKRPDLSKLETGVKSWFNSSPNRNRSNEK